MAQKVMFLRVGADTQYGGGFGPIYEDGTFDYVPIPDDGTLEKRTYNTIIGRKGLPFSTFVPKNVRDSAVHYDPFFGDVFTYGEGAERDQPEMWKLEAGDLLVFYVTLAPFLNGRLDKKAKNQYIIGYFLTVCPPVTGYLKPECFSGGHQIKGPASLIFGAWIKSFLGEGENKQSVERLGRLSSNPESFLEDAQVPPQIRENAHFKRFLFTKQTDFTIVGGDPARSQLLDKPIPLTDVIPGNYPFQLKAELAEAWDLWGGKGAPLNMMRKVPHWVTEESRVRHLKEFLGINGKKGEKE